MLSLASITAAWHRAMGSDAMMKLDRVSLAVLWFLVVLGVPTDGSDAQAQEAPAWEGAWDWLHERNVGRLILVEGAFCGVFGAKERTAPPGALSESVRADCTERCRIPCAARRRWSFRQTAIRSS